MSGQDFDDDGEFQIRVIPDSGSALVALAGEIDLASLPEIRATFAEVFAERPVVIAVDLAGVTYLGSDGIRGLLDAMRTALNRGVPFRITAASPIVRNALELAGLDQWFGTSDAHRD